MVLQSTGQIKLSEIQTEFGGTNPISLSEYYSNAASGYTSEVSGLPNIGSLIKLSNFYGKSKGISYIWQFFNNSYCSSGEFISRVVLSKTTTTIQNILDNVINNPSYLAVYIYDGVQTTANTWQISYISTTQKIQLLLCILDMVL